MRGRVEQARSQAGGGGVGLRVVLRAHGSSVFGAARWSAVAVDQAQHGPLRPQHSQEGPNVCFNAYFNSVRLGHPGRLAFGYGGYKALIPGLTRGRHTVVSKVGFGGRAPHTITYVITSR